MYINIYSYWHVSSSCVHSNTCNHQNWNGIYNYQRWSILETKRTPIDLHFQSCREAKNYVGEQYFHGKIFAINLNIYSIMFKHAAESCLYLTYNISFLFLRSTNDHHKFNNAYVLWAGKEGRTNLNCQAWKNSISQARTAVINCYSFLKGETY